MENLKEEEAILKEIMSIRDQIAVMGANDSEFSEISEIMKKLGNNELTATEALGEVRAIMNRKSSYH